MHGLKGLLERHPRASHAHYNDRGARLVPSTRDIEQSRRELLGGAYYRRAVAAHVQSELDRRALERAVQGKASMSRSDEAGLSGSIYLEIRDSEGRRRRRHAKSNLILDRGMYRFLDMLTGGVSFASEFPSLDTPGTDCFSTLIISDSKLVPIASESDGAINARAGSVVGSIVNTSRDALLSFFNNTPSDRLRMVFVFGTSDPISDQEFSSIGWAEGADAGDAGSQSRWGARAVVGRPATALGTSRVLADLLDSVAETVAVSTENGGDVKANSVDDTLTTVWGTTELDEAAQWEVTFPSAQSGVISVSVAVKTAGDDTKFPDQFEIQLDQGSGYALYTGITLVSRGLPGVDGSGVFIQEVVGGAATGLKQAYVNALDEGTTNYLTFTFDVGQSNVDGIRFVAIKNGEVGVALKSMNVTSDGAGTRLTRDSGTTFAAGDVGKVIQVTGEILTEITNFVDADNVDVSPAVTGSLSATAAQTEEPRSIEIADVSINAIDNTAYTINGANNVLRIRGGLRRRRAFNGSTDGPGTTFSKANDDAPEGSLVAVYGSEIPDGADFYLFDGVNNVGGSPPGTRFIFDKDASVSESTYVRAINITDGDDPATVATAIRNAVTGASSLNITPGGSGADVTLVNTVNGAAGDNLITGSAVDLLEAEGFVGGHASGDASPAFTADDVGHLLVIDPDGSREEVRISGFTADTLTLASAVSGGLTGKEWEILDVEDFREYSAAFGTPSGATLVADINDAALLARLEVGGDGLSGRFECFDNGLNQIAFRAKGEGDDSYLEVDSVANGSTINDEIGLPNGGTRIYGKTLTFVKATGEVLTVVYDFNFDNRVKFGGGAQV